MQIYNNPYTVPPGSGGISAISGARPYGGQPGQNSGVRSGTPELLPSVTEYKSDSLRQVYRGETYGPNARLRGPEAGSGQADPAGQAARLDPASERTLNRLEARDQQVRDTEDAKGKAVGGGDQYIYQTGPDGQRYAIGTKPHLVRPHGAGAEGAAEGPGLEGASLPGGSPLAGSSVAGRPESGPGNEEFTSRLESRDQEVRQHEHAHLAAAGHAAAGMPEYDYQVGPDGKRYAVGGSVNISLTSVPGDPDATRRNADSVIRAAMAPGSPSGQDYKVAQDARSMKSRADAEETRMEKAEQEELQGARDVDAAQSAQWRKAMSAYGGAVSNSLLMQSMA